MPRPTSQTASGSASAASPTMPLSTPIEVMPIWIADRKRVGSSPSRIAQAAAPSPSIDAHLQARLAGGDERDFRESERAVEQDQRGEDQDFH